MLKVYEYADYCWVILLTDASTPLAGTARPTPFENKNVYTMLTLLSYVLCICSDFGLLSFVYVNCRRMSRRAAYTVTGDQTATINISYFWQEDFSVDLLSERLVSQVSWFCLFSSPPHHLPFGAGRGKCSSHLPISRWPTTLISLHDLWLSGCWGHKLLILCCFSDISLVLVGAG